IRHNSVSGESAFVAEDIAGNATEYDATLSVHLTDWINDRFLLSACNEFGCSTLPEHDVSLLQELSAQAVTYAKVSNAGALDIFGTSVALDGDTLAVGAYGENSAATGVNGDPVDDCGGAGLNCATGSGAVYVFRRTSTGWVQEAYIKASNADAGDLFGYSI